VFTITLVAAEVDEHPPLVTVTVYDPEAVAEIACVVAPPGDQTLPVALLDVNVTLPPAQNVVAPPAVIVGVAGFGLTVTVVAAEVDEQPPLVTVTVYDPEAVAEIACVVAPPGDQTLPVALLEVKVTLPPVQNVVAPPAVMVGVAGFVLTVTVVAAEVDEHPPLVTVTVYDPDAVAEIACVVAPPGDQTLPVALLDVSVTLPPAQNVVAPPAVIVGVAGFGLTVTVVAAEVDEHPPLVTVTVYDPDAVAEIACVVAPPGDQTFPVALLDVKVTLPPVQNVVAPPAVIVGVAGEELIVTVTGFIS